MTPLTPKQKNVLQFIEKYQFEQGYAPTQQEIAKHFGFRSLGTVQNYLVRLEREGFLEKTLNAQRSVKVVPKPQPQRAGVGLYGANVMLGTVSLPLVGRVAAGRPIEAIENREFLDVPASLLKMAGEHFVLRIAGDSMIEDGILDGDYVVIRKQKDAQNGQTVVALIGNEATIKHYYRKGAQVELRAANPAYDPIVVDSMVGPSGFHIEGVLVGLIRKVE